MPGKKVGHVMGDSRYTLHEVIGQGGMAQVWEATDLVLRRTVAVKVMHEHLLPDDAAHARFLREARAAASLNHPCIAMVYDTGVLPDPVRRPYIAMEYVQGRTIAEQVLLTPPSIEESVQWTAGILEALEYAHAAGLVHRDIKPANVMLTTSGQVKVMDFGIAFATGGGETGLTAAGNVLGTATYMSPEQAQGQAVDARSDLYSVGCMLYELLTGRPPHMAETPIAIAYRHVHTSPVPPSLLNPAVVPPLEAAVLRALAKKPDDRFSTAAAMHEALLGSFSSVSVSVEAPRPADTEPAGTALMETPSRTHVRSRRRVALAITGLLAVGGVVAAAALHTSGSSPSATTTRTQVATDSPTSHASSGSASASDPTQINAAAGTSAPSTATSATSTIRTSVDPAGTPDAGTTASPDASSTSSGPTALPSSVTTPVVSALPTPSTTTSDPRPSPTISIPLPSPK
jgi:serine/threonine protein kinase